jgi:hypothetical protein
MGVLEVGYKQSMKKINISHFSFLILSFFTLNIVHADTCVKPTPPTTKCYSTIKNENTVGEDNKYYYIEQSTKQVEVPCGNNSEQINYSADMISYNVCSQIDTMKGSEQSLDTYKSSDLHQQAIASTPRYHLACPYPVQPTSQTSQAVVDSAWYVGTTIKKYSDGTYALFNVRGIYEWPATESYFNDMVQWQKDVSNIDKIVNGTYPSQTAWNGTSLMLGNDMDMDARQISLNARESSIDKWLSDKSNCPTSTPLDVYDSITGSKLHCPADTYKDIDKDGKEICVPKIVTNSTTPSTIDASSTPKVSSFRRTLKKGMVGDDVKQLQILLQKLNYLPSTQVPSTYFGSITSNAVTRFQKDNKIQPATGSFGQITQIRLISLVK